MKRAIWIILWFFFTSDCNAQTIVKLKNGKTEEGELVEEADDYLRLYFYDLGIALTYWKSEIESIEKSINETAGAERMKRLLSNLEANPGVASNYSLLKSIAYSTAGNEKTISYLEQAIRICPFPEIAAALQRRIGSIYLSRGEYERAIGAYEIVVKQYHNLPQETALAHNSIAKAYYEKGDFVQAKEALGVIIQKHRTQVGVYSDALIYLGCIAYEIGDAEGARGLWRQADEAESHDKPGIAAFLADNATLDEIDSYVKLTPSYNINDIYFLIGIKLESMKKASEAAIYYKKSLESRLLEHDFPFLSVKRGLKRIG